MARFFAVEDPAFQPAMRLVTAITQANPAAVKTSFDHDYRTGDIVRLYVPDGYGMIQADKLKGEITVTGTDTFTIDIDTSAFDALVIPSPLPWYINSTPHVLPVGEINSSLDAAVQNVL